MTKAMRWILIAAGLIAVVLAASYFLFQRQIGQMLFERAVTQRVAQDPTADLPDGLHVYMCGTGSPMADHNRAGPCVGIVAGEQAVLFDVGAGSMRTAGRMGFPVARTQSLYLTHLHSDHFDGIGELLVQAWVGGSRDTPLPVLGPAGTIETVEGINAAYRVDSSYRTAHHGAAVANPDGYGFAPVEVEITQGDDNMVVFDRDGLTITAFPVFHDPIVNPVGYRIDYGGRSVVISGDTIYQDRLVAAAQDVDILIHEALDPDMIGLMEQAAEDRGADAIAKILFDIQDYHASPEDAARAAQEAGAGQLVLYHIVPPLPTNLLNAFFLGDADSLFDGPIHVGEDGMRISLPADSDTVTISNTLR